MTGWWDTKSGVSYKQYNTHVFDLTEWTFKSDAQRGHKPLSIHHCYIREYTCPCVTDPRYFNLKINSFEIIVSPLEGEDYHRDTRIVVVVTPKFVPVTNHLEPFTISWLLHRGRLFYTIHTLHGIQLSFTYHPALNKLMQVKG